MQQNSEGLNQKSLKVEFITMNFITKRIFSLMVNSYMTASLSTVDNMKTFWRYNIWLDKISTVSHGQEFSRPKYFG